MVAVRRTCGVPSSALGTASERSTDDQSVPPHAWSMARDADVYTVPDSDRAPASDGAASAMRASASIFRRGKTDRAQRAHRFYTATPSETACWGGNRKRMGKRKAVPGA